MRGSWRKLNDHMTPSHLFGPAASSHNECWPAWTIGTIFCDGNQGGSRFFIDIPRLKQHSSNNVPEMPSCMLIHVRLFASDARGFVLVHLLSEQHGTITQPQCTENLISDVGGETRCTEFLLCK